MKRSGSADLPLHYGHVPQWLAQRMSALGLAITESVIAEYGKDEFLKRIADPFWFQSLGAVMGMDWHSSGITTSVMGALRRSINPLSKELGIYICGGKGKYSKQTPDELLKVGERTGLDASLLIRSSKLSAKVDNNAVQDGFQLYTHNFIVSNTGKWSIVQQGMNGDSKMARRYHWHSDNLSSFIEEPHTGVCGVNNGQILNLTAKDADTARSGIAALSSEQPEKLLREMQYLKMPDHHELRAVDINLKRLGTVLWLAHEAQPQNFEELLLLKDVGPRAVQSLALVSEVIHGTPVRFSDPARFSFAHGGKDGHPFPVPLKVYDETINVLRNAVDKAKLGNSEKASAIKKLHELSVQAEENFNVSAAPDFDALIEKERNDSWKYGGKTVFGDAKKIVEKTNNRQLDLF